MLRKLSLPISLLLTVALCFAAHAQDGTSKEKGQEFYQLIQTVQDLLHGRTLIRPKPSLQMARLWSAGQRLKT